MNVDKTDLLVRMTKIAFDRKSSETAAIKNYSKYERQEYEKYNSSLFVSEGRKKIFSSVILIVGTYPTQYYKGKGLLLFYFFLSFSLQKYYNTSTCM